MILDPETHSPEVRDSSGKTRLVEAVTEVLLGSARAVLKIDCAEFQHGHEIAKLIGSPQGEAVSSGREDSRSVARPQGRSTHPAVGRLPSDPFWPGCSVWTGSGLVPFRKHDPEPARGRQRAG